MSEVAIAIPIRLVPLIVVTGRGIANATHICVVIGLVGVSFIQPEFRNALRLLLKFRIGSQRSPMFDPASRVAILSFHAESLDDEWASRISEICLERSRACCSPSGVQSLLADNNRFQSIARCPESEPQFQPPQTEPFCNDGAWKSQSSAHLRQP